MGACMFRDAEDDDDDEDAATSEAEHDSDAVAAGHLGGLAGSRRRGRRRRRRRRLGRHDGSVLRGVGGRHAGVGSRRGSSSAFSDSTSSLAAATSTGISVAKNRPLRHEKIRWKSDVPLTEGQLRSKRDEFWDTAPAFEGKAEIWAALKAAVETVETAQDFELAQAILDGAGISLPHGSLVECYDELGMRYSIPVYCLSYPINLVVASAEDDKNGRDSPAEFSEPADLKDGREMKIRVRVSVTGRDIKMVLNSAQTVASAKRMLHAQDNIGEPSRQRWYYGGKMLSDKSKLGDVNIPNGYVVQCVLSGVDFNVIRAKD